MSLSDALNFVNMKVDVGTLLAFFSLVAVGYFAVRKVLGLVFSCWTWVTGAIPFTHLIATTLFVSGLAMGGTGLGTLCSSPSESPKEAPSALNGKALRDIALNLKDVKEDQSKALEAILKYARERDSLQPLPTLSMAPTSVPEVRSEYVTPTFGFTELLGGIGLALVGGIMGIRAMDRFDKRD